MKISFFLIFLSIVCSAFFTACNKNESEVFPVIKVDKTTLSMASVSGKDSIYITANTNWTLEDIPDWLSVSPTNGNGDTRVYLTYLANTSLNPRTASVALKGRGEDITLIHLDQMGSGPFIKSDKSTLTVQASGKKDTIIVTSNVPWNLSIPSAAASWISTDKTSSTEDSTTIILTVAPNTTTAPKSASLTFTGAGATVTPVSIDINQEQPDVKINHFTPRAPGGASISINGTGFSAIPSENIVKINGVTATVSTASATSLAVTVPSKVGSGPIQVTVNTKSDTSRYEFTYDWTGVVTVFAGSTGGHADGMGSAAKFYRPAGLDIDDMGNLYVADYGNYKVRKITPAGVVTTLPGRIPSWSNRTGPNTDFDLPNDVAVDGSGNVYVAESNYNAISEISSSGLVTILAGGSVNSGYADGVGSDALFYGPTGLEIDATGNLIVVDSRNHKIRKVSPTGMVTTIAGSRQSFDDGTGPAAQFNTPFDIALDPSGNYLITDYYNNRIRRVTPMGVVTTFAGTGSHGSADGTVSTSQVYKPQDIAVDASGNVYVCDGNTKIRWITPEGEVRTIHTSVTLSALGGIAVDGNGSVYVSDSYNNKICKVQIQ